MADHETPRVLFTNANFAQSPALLASPVRHGQYARELGYDGLEYHPLLPWIYTPDAVISAVQSGRLSLDSMHMSFRTNEQSRNTNNFGGNDGPVAALIDSPLGGLLMPEMVASTEYMARVQARLPRPVPVVLYPQLDPDLDKRMKSRATLNGRAKAYFQPTDHLSRMVGARSAAELAEIMLGDRGYDGICLDVFHARRRYGQPSPGITSDERSLESLLPHTRAAHLSLNRRDQRFPATEPHIATAQDLDDALSGNYRGYVRDALDGIKESEKVEYVVVELLVHGLRRAAKGQGITTRRQAYHRIANNLKSYLTV